MHLPGYTLIGELHRDRTRVVFRAGRDTDGAVVILKAIADEFPSPAESASLRREYDMLRSFQADGVARAVTLARFRDRVVLVLEDAGAATLTTLIVHGTLDLPAALRFARQLAASLAAVHDAGIVHKDVNPNTVIVEPVACRATLDRQHQAKLKAEGRLMGEWVDLLEAERGRRVLDAQPLQLDLEQVIDVDDRGLETLRRLPRGPATLVGCTPILLALLAQETRP